MSYRGNQRNFRNNREKRRIDDDSNEQQHAENPVMKQFLNYRKELDAKHDRNERLVKLSRDITIEAKRIIFLLHNIDARQNNKQQILDEANERLTKLINTNFTAIAKELKGHEIFQFLRAVSPGIQEFIEALTFHEYLSGIDHSDWEKIQEKLKYKEETGEEFSLFLPPCEWLLGLADLTGEILRFSINSLASGETENCFKTCKFLQSIYAKFLSIGNIPNHGRDFSQKLNTMKMSTLKTEQVCYQLVVRGNEGAKFPHLDIAIHDNDVDEGFY